MTSLPYALSPVWAAAKDFKVDAGHSFVTFKVKHKNVGYAFGRFNKMSGTIKFDEAEPAATSLQFTIETASVDTANEGRDKHLRGPDFFDVKQFPVMTFKSKSAKKTGDKLYALTGELTLRGVTKSITAPVEHVGIATSPRGTSTGALCTFKIKRSDYGMTYGLGSLGDWVDITVALEANGK
jgi:polyisoprenoid-binding protein YceI